MGNKNLWRIWIFYYILIMIFNHIQNIFAAGSFELQILEISNDKSHLLSGYCCGSSSAINVKHQKTSNCPTCVTSFRLCLKEFQVTNMPKEQIGFFGCAYGNTTTPVLGGSSFVLQEPNIETIKLPFTFRWTQSFSLVLQALDALKNSTTPEIVEEVAYSDKILPPSDWKTLDHIGKNARITYRIRVICDENYFNSSCLTFCRPRNDNFGHYICNEGGEKVCHSYWTGVNCEKAVCKDGCDLEHGTCTKPETCDCRSGWQGPLCNDCMVYPGCKHGYCNKPWECLCDRNWGGILCDQDLNYCGTHEPCMHGGTCENKAPDQYECTCPEGLSGTRCEIVEHPCAPMPCKNGGTCIQQNKSKEADSYTPRQFRGMSSMGSPVSHRPMDLKKNISTAIMSELKEFICTCPIGWTGPTCEINIDECADSPCKNGATCEDLVGGFRCKCPPNWTGDVCDEDVNECQTSNAILREYGKCVNAQACKNTPGGYECICLEGWDGDMCDHNINDCEGQCKNGGSCIDLVNKYHCACAPGFSGKDCLTNIDECVHRPCQNGAECVDMVNNFSCICKVGYSGTLCEISVDYCLSSPCMAGNCLNTQGSFYCQCPRGRSGKHCELMKSSCLTENCHDGCIPFNASPITSLCSGNGKCFTNSTTSICICKEGYSGHYCEKSLNNCVPNPCKNNGICIDLDGDYNCECSSGWTGKSCQEVVVRCQHGQCQNGGTCSNTDGVSQCRCGPGWKGSFCNEPANLCATKPCFNGGTCESGDGWFRCVCSKGFTGPDCRINVNECSTNPCYEGSTCVDGFGEFNCICPPTRRGRTCEIMLSNSVPQCSDISSSENLDNNCNSCHCTNSIAKCSNIWCGLPNCVNSTNYNECESNEVCVPATKETCLSPPCIKRGDCREVEASRRVAPPKFPTSPKCWPNQATLDEQCSRVSIILDVLKLEHGTSTEDFCHSLRTLLGGKLLEKKHFASAQLIIICDIKTGTNDTIEVTVSSSHSSSKKSDNTDIPRAVRLLGEILSRPKMGVKNYYLEDYPEAAALNAILEIKVETAIVNEDGRQSYLLIVFIGIVLIAISCVAYGVLVWRQRTTICSRQSEINLSVTEVSQRHDEEKSNNLQNEENFRRYTNPLKGSALSVRSSMELTLSPNLENMPGTSGLNRSQCLYTPTDITNDFDQTPGKSNINSQTLYKTQNFDVEKNTVQSIESSNKDFDKRSIKCHMAKTTSSPIRAINSIKTITSLSSNISSLSNLSTNDLDTLTVHI